MLNDKQKTNLQDSNILNIVVECGQNFDVTDHGWQNKQQNSLTLMTWLIQIKMWTASHILNFEDNRISHFYANKDIEAPTFSLYFIQKKRFE